MSASTVSVTRRRKNPTGEATPPTAVTVTAAAAVSGDLNPDSGVKNLSQTFSGEAVKKPLPSATGTARKTHRKPVSKPKWATIVSVLTKNLLLLIVIVGLVQMVRRLVYNTDKDGFSVSTGTEFENRIAELDGLLKKTTKMIQVQVDLVDKKVDKGLTEVKLDLNNVIKSKNDELVKKMVEYNVKIEGLEKALGELSSENWLKRDDLDRFIDEIKKRKTGDGGIGDLSFDEVREVARTVVEKELEKFAADGLGRVDYAVGSGGAMVVKHSETYGVGRGIGWFKMVKNGVHDSSVKMISPSFGEPGQCFPLKGSSGFVQIKLRTAIVPDAVTLEHVSKSVAFDRSSAPKDCQIFGWLQKHDVINHGVDTAKMILLTEFTYDLEKSNAQTFKVLDTPIVVDTIRFNFTSNHGNLAHTCIYRLRVHGREAESIPVLAEQS